MLTTWRLLKVKYANRALSGEGARLYGGRWNSPGRLVIYTAESLALAALEILVHVKSHEELSNYQKIKFEFDEGLFTDIKQESLSVNWRAGRTTDETRQLGDAWLKRNDYPILRVPSVIIPEEWNYLLNPLNPKFSKIKASSTQPFSFDPRLTYWSSRFPKVSKFRNVAVRKT